MKLTLIENGEVFAPEPLGRTPVLAIDGRIAHLGPIDARALAALPFELERVDASGQVVAPGFVDPHAHLIGTGGEQGFASRTSDVSYDELISAGVTTVVGCLGTCDVTRALPSLVGRVRQLQRWGITALAYTGSFYVPPPTLTGSVRDDLVLIPEFIGVGELAIADFRANEPSPQELARLATECLVGGLLGECAGVVHFHVGPGKRRLQVLREVVDRFEVPARHLYPTHVMRSEALMDEAIALATRGAFVDMDTIDDPVGKWVRYFLAHGGPRDRFTVSSDAHAPNASHPKYRQRFDAAILEEGLSLEALLPMFTRNPAEALKLPNKGRIRVGGDADLQIFQRDSLALHHVFTQGTWRMRDGAVAPPRQDSSPEALERALRE
jgi:beta-aspartyl-dipeptidase (metallo-type)